MARIIFPWLIVPTPKLQQQPLVTEQPVLEQDLSTISSGLPTKSEPRSVLDASNCCRLIGAQPAFPADLVHHNGERGEVIVRRLLRVFGEETVRIDAQGKLVGSLSRPPACFPVQFDQRHEALRHAADYGQRHRQAQCTCPHHRLWRAADGNPNR